MDVLADSLTAEHTFIESRFKESRLKPLFKPFNNNIAIYFLVVHIFNPFIADNTVNCNLPISLIFTP